MREGEAKFIHEVSEYAANHGIPTIHEAPALASEEVRRLRFDLAGIRHALQHLASEYPDGTCMNDPESFERKWADKYGCGHPKDPGFQMDRVSYFARTEGLSHPEVAAVISQVSGWESRLPQDFEAVLDEYLAWHKDYICQEMKMFRDWQEEVA